MEQTRWKRPWLAAVLGILATGLGHIYLRRWRRAVGWLLAAFTTTILFVPPSALETLTTVLRSGSGSVPLVDLLPLLAVGVASVLDAYFVAHTNNRRVMEQTMGIQRCPNCGRQIDPDVSFCQWCATTRADASDQ